ncbi:MAG: response regulator transcription factor [Burkholderiales bacterium]|nr:MAG: response regulator transcription factor [Burkholderiales bacterium]
MQILVADDHALIREGLRLVLRDFDPPIDWIDAADGDGVRRALAEHPDIELVLLDRQLPDCDGIVLLGELLPRHPVPIVIMSGDASSDAVRDAIDAGAAGFIPKTSVNRVLVSALRLILEGGIYVPPEVVRSTPAPAEAVAARAPAPAGTRLAATGASAGHGGADAEPHAEPSTARNVEALARSLGLTDRQLGVLALLMEGMSNKRIGRELDLAEATVKVHVRAVLRALEVHSRTEAVVAMTRLGWTTDRLRALLACGRETV